MIPKEAGWYWAVRKGKPEEDAFILMVINSLSGMKVCGAVDRTFCSPDDFLFLEGPLERPAPAPLPTISPEMLRKVAAGAGRGEAIKDVVGAIERAANTIESLAEEVELLRAACCQATEFMGRCIEILKEAP